MVSSIREGRVNVLERIIIFGASGDMTARLLMPAITQVGESGLLPERLTIVGSATRDWSTDDFKEHIAAGLAKYAPKSGAQCRDDILRRLSYEAADVTSGADLTRVLGKNHEPTLVYLALPSGLIEPALLALTQADLSHEDAIAIEKPFGENLESAKRLNELLESKLHRPKIFRIDHFLSNELVRRILSLRFMNRVFEPSFNCHEIERIEINWFESLALEGRASYYDKAGAMKDMIQNHLLEALSLVIMNQPARLDAASFRAMRVEALRTIKTPTEADVRRGTVRARYSAGKVGDRSVPAYVNEKGVDPTRNTETYASVDLQVRNPRWENTRFVLRSGKALPRHCAEVAIHYRSIPSYLGKSSEGIEPNVLRVGLMEPYVRLDTVVNGPDFSSVNHQLEMTSAPPSRKAYANLIIEMLKADPMLFIRGDESEEAWRIVDPIADGWRRGVTPLEEYAAGSLAPGMPG
jgi:glucose-6-phosphate 1-dehydrogenase